MTLKVISLNMWAGKLLPQAIEFLKQQDADVVLLQEVTNARAADLPEKHRIFDVLTSRLDYEYSNYAYCFSYNFPEGIVPEGSAILSKLPIKQSSSRFFVEPTKEYYQDIPADWPVVPRILQYVELGAQTVPVNVINVHGIWDLDGDNDSLERRKMVQAIIETEANKPNVIVSGDTNAKASNVIWQRLEEHLKSVFGQELKTTFNMRRKDNPGYATAAVDLMFVSPDIEVIDKALPDVDISDHLPLVVTLDIP
jgi:endonuclease/exonuclease/phosphatase family metal-dependent hydrolase